MTATISGRERSWSRARGWHSSRQPGRSTEFARIAVLTQDTVRPDTPLTRELHRLVRTIALIAVGVGGGFFLLTLFLDTPTSDGFVFAIGITVALVPEGLLPTVTLSLAIGAQRMADEHALVRRLESVETLGSTTFICTDKTGTLTQNRMRIVEVWMPSVRVRRDGTGYEPTGEIEPMTRCHLRADSPNWRWSHAAVREGESFATRRAAGARRVIRWRPRSTR